MDRLAADAPISANAAAAGYMSRPRSADGTEGSLDVGQRCDNITDRSVHGFGYGLQWDFDFSGDRDSLARLPESCTDLSFELKIVDGVLEGNAVVLHESIP